jgi:hypothetical protein
LPRVSDRRIATRRGCGECDELRSAKSSRLIAERDTPPVRLRSGRPEQRRRPRHRGTEDRFSRSSVSRVW